MEIETVGSEGIQQREHQGCWGRAVSRCMRYCYLVPRSGVRVPSPRERLSSAVNGLCVGVFYGASMGGISSNIASLCEKSGIIINENLFWKIVIPIISSFPLGGAIHGALHPSEERLRIPYSLMTNNGSEERV